VPTIPNLAGFDFVVYDHQKHHVYLVQVTVEDTAKRHRDKSLEAIYDPDSRLMYWLSALKTKFWKKNPTWYEVYITENESGCMDDYNAVKISELVDTYPALASYSPS
jgi:hypothetical protein